MKIPKVEILSIFLASPSDVQTERKQAREVIDDINRTVAKEKGVHLEVSGWDTDAYPSYGGDAQSIINQQIADMKKYDLFIGIMWNRFGQPTPRAGSGTEEEFDLAVDAFKLNGRPNIMFYFSQSPFNPTSVQDAEQKMKVLQFKTKVQNGGALTWDYSNVQDFRNVFHKHLLRWLIERTVTAPEPPAITEHTSLIAMTNSTILTAPKEKVPEVITESGMWVMLGESFYEAEEVEEKDDKTISVQIIPRNTADDATLKSLQNYTQSHYNEQVPYSHQNTAGIARVLSAKRLSNAGKSIWTINLQLEQNENNLYNEFTINGTTPEQIATLRARLMLLNETPPEDSYLFNGPGRSKIMPGKIVNTGITASHGIFPELWHQFRDQTDYFLPLARLWAVFQLITSKTCEHILELTLGPLQGTTIQIYFRGRRHKRYNNEDPAIIEVKGECDLSGRP